MGALDSLEELQIVTSYPIACSRPALLASSDGELRASMPGPPNLGPAECAKRLTTAAPDRMEGNELCEVLLWLGKTDFVRSCGPRAFRRAWVLSLEGSARPALGQRRAKPQNPL